MMTNIQLDESIHTAELADSHLDQETFLIIMAQAAACHLNESEMAESIARVRARLMREFGVT